MSTCNQLDLQKLGSQPIMPKNLPDHCTKLTSTMLITALNFKLYVRDKVFNIDFIQVWCQVYTPVVGVNAQLVIM